MTAPTKPEIRDAIERAADARPGAFSSASIEDAISNWALNLDETLWQRWSCDSDSCPARPEWDKRISELFEVVTSKAVAECDAIVERHLIGMAETLFAEFPDAPRAEREAAAA